MKQHYDSRPDTYQHINQVQSVMAVAINDLLQRAVRHDQSKLESPELEVFNEYTPKLKDSTYGSDEYKAFLAGMKVGLDHHYAANSHHPEHSGRTTCAQCGQLDNDPCTCGGPRLANVTGMSLLDLIEMLCDWKAATMRHANGDLRKSIDINQKRFAYSDEIRSILINTAERMGMMPLQENAAD